MTTKPHRDPDTFTLAVSAVMSLVLVALEAGVVYLVVTRPMRGDMLGVVGFFALIFAGLLAFAMSPWSRFVRDRAAVRALSTALGACPACGLRDGSDAVCAGCGLPREGREAHWQAGRIEPLETVGVALLGAAFVPLAMFCALYCGGSAPLVVVGLALGALGLWLAWMALRHLVLSRGQPYALRYQRTWTHGDATVTCNTTAHRADGVWTVSGTCEAPGVEPHEDDFVTATDDDFERGLARMLARWDRDERAPLLYATVTRWSWRSDARAPTVVGGGYREGAAPTNGTIERAVAPAWRVSFNEHPWGELLGGEGLALGAAALDDDEAVELADAEWGVDLPVIVRVLRRDPALVGALEARGRDDDDDDARVVTALTALRAR